MINERDLEYIKSIKDFYTKFLPTEEEAVEYVENIRWEEYTTCPYCNKDNVYKCKDIKRPYKCRGCNVKFSVKTGTIIQGSNVSV